jgi:hypothetical protein
MTLITIGQTTGYKDVRKWKNQFWENKGITPNEAYKLDQQYKDCVRSFKVMHEISGPNRFYEVRIVKQRPSIILTGRDDKHWWDTVGLMDHVFWVFQQPIYDKRMVEPYGFYVLEPMECKRVCQILSARYHIKEPEYPGCFIIPTENCVMAWSETANGVSEHIHHRPEFEPTQEQIDKEEADNEAVEQLLGEALNSPKLMEQFAQVQNPVPVKK